MRYALRSRSFNDKEELINITFSYGHLKSFISQLVLHLSLCIHIFIDREYNQWSIVFGFVFAYILHIFIDNEYKKWIICNCIIVYVPHIFIDREYNQWSMGSRRGRPIHPQALHYLYQGHDFIIQYLYLFIYFFGHPVFFIFFSLFNIIPHRYSQVFILEYL